MIDRNSCGYVPRNELTKKGKENERANRIEWEHIMPAENFGKHLTCWKDGGRKACSKDKTFYVMRNKFPFYFSKRAESIYNIFRPLI